jgi:hypothetical protein
VRRLLIATTVVLLAFACDDDDDDAIDPLPRSEGTSPAPTPPPKEPTPPETAPSPSPGSDPLHESRDPVPTLSELLDVLGDEDDPDARPTRPRTLADCITAGYEDVADLESAMAVDGDGALIILEAYVEESGHGIVTLYRHETGGEHRLLSFEGWGAPVAALRRRLRRWGRLETLPNLVRTHAYAQFSLDTYAPMVGLSGPLDGWVVWHETTGIADRETDPHAECTLAMLEAEGDLCTHPATIHQVVLTPGGELVVSGLIVHPGHDGYSQSRWVVDLPPELRP